MKRPHVLASAAVSIDGFLDDDTPDRLVLSGPADLDRVDAERAGVDAILVGAGTVRADDPRLLVRSERRRADRVVRGLDPSPLRVVLSAGALDPHARVFTEGRELADTVVLGGTPDEVLARLADQGVVRLMVEGGAAVHHDFLAAAVVDEIQLAVAPRLVGAGPRFTGAPAHAHLVETRRVGADVLLRYRLGDADGRWLAEACTLAERCPPSPSAFSVGCVVVGADGTVLATGYSRRDHVLDHAEEAALRDVDPDDPRLAGATMYTSLEPCGQRASRPVPCTQHILDAGIGRVVMAWREPPVFVGAPSGVARLADAGVTVVERPEFTELARRPNRHR
ncbi:dihydrofolate reductase family protein [Actinomycetospora cinnamomea]|uniref:Riboflavin biosynthesis protein RibD n=1 Tax=Actinomycetospora cinnamomea TaxID=663609 RepID=A0A2U1FQN8_9PSEU|nr:dihydrofolate reductase family protein [Actinomycetospora cinnamomea]PVZ14466.1 diaminohydroxyphosphoribosylaminopyrimidine deaminase [Actinomycetospora cinnamomea]